jgi:putative aldouronate transport system substrate-binding protein
MKKKLIFAVLILILCGAMVFATGRQASGSVPTLTWWLIGGTPANFADGLKVISDYTESKIGVRLDIKLASWAEAGTRRNTVINSGEYFDIMFVDGGDYSNWVNLGAFTDITDMLGTAAPQLKSFIPAGLWDGVRINGRIYAVPAYKDSSKTDYFIWDDTYVRKYSLDIAKIHTFAELDAAFRKMKAGEGARFYPLPLSQGGLFNFVYADDYDPLGIGLPPIGVKFTDTNRRVVSVLEQPDTMDKLRYLNRWYKDGIVNPDAPVVQDAPNQKPFMIAQGWPLAAVGWARSNGVEKYVVEKAFGPMYYTDTIQGSMAGISSNSRYKTEALKLLELVNTDRKMRDMMAYGIEGVNFTYVKPSVVHLINDQWNPARYQQGTFFTMSDMEGSEGQWDEVHQQNDQASQSVMNGFIFDNSSVMNEVTNCGTIGDKYRTELLTGASDPDVVVPAFIRELNAAGFQKIIQEAQRQVDAFKR